MIHSPEPFRVYSPGVASAVIEGIKRRKRWTSGHYGTDLSVNLYDQASSVGAGPSFNGQFASIFPGALQVVQTDLGLTYGGTLLAGGGATDAVTMTGTLAGTPVPILAKGSGPGVVDIYYDGGTTPAMSGLTPVAGTPIVLTGAGAGLSLTWGTIAGIAIGNTWTATCAGLADQSGNGKHYSQATAGKQPILTIGLNGKASITGDGSDDQITSALTLPAPSVTPTTVLAVIAQQTWTVNRAIYGSNTSEFTIRGLQGNVTPALRMSTAGPIATGNPALGSWCRLINVFTGSAADFIKNGSSAQVTGLSAGATAQTSMALLNQNGGTLACNASLLAFIVLSGVISAGTRTAFENAINSSAGYGVGNVLV